VDEEGRTMIPGLWSAGEAASTGLHGANRLGSNSLLEGAVFGLRAGRGASSTALTQPNNFTAVPLVSEWPHSEAEDEELNLVDLGNSLTALMWRNVGIRRDADGLKDAREQIDFWDRYVSAREFYDPRGWELQNLLLTGRMMTAAAASRTESRGVHFRSDFAETDKDQAAHIQIISE
jgi:L-aspartate oxidase